VIADGRGRAAAFALVPGQAHELPLAPGLLDRLPRVPLWVVGDRGYSSDAFRELIWSSGARPAIPTRSNEAVIACPDSSNYPQVAPAMAAPSLMSMRRDHPRHITVLPGGGSEARAR
jgi:hypothetical protein